MAKYIVKHTCGHQVEVQLFGKYADREKRIAWLETQECDECRRAKANAEAATMKEARGLQDLTGSEKQVAWANTIREKAYKCLDTLTQFATNDQAKAMMETWKSKMDAETTAKWWIDNRYNIPTDSHPQAAREIVRMFNDLFKA
jgi:hypothetical protein